MIRIRLKASVKSNKQVASYSQAVKSGSKIQHVIPVDGNWAVKSINSKRNVRIFLTQKEAIDYGRNIAKNKKTDLIIYTRQGDIRDRKSYK